MAAKDKPKQEDQISVSGHIAVPGGAILRFIATEHYGRRYIYAERAQGEPITLLDIAKPSQPTVVSQLDASSGAANLVAVAGTAALSATILSRANYCARYEAWASC